MQCSVPAGRGYPITDPLVDPATSTGILSALPIIERHPANFARSLGRRGQQKGRGVRRRGRRGGAEGGEVCYPGFISPLSQLYLAVISALSQAYLGSICLLCFDPHLPLARPLADREQ